LDNKVVENKYSLGHLFTKLAHLLNVMFTSIL